jgi:hypothetical protein
MCPGSLKVVTCGPFARTIACPVCARRLRPIRKTIDGRRAQLRSHTRAAAAAKTREG